MSEESVRKSCRMVIDMIIEYYGPHYLNRRPSGYELARITAGYEKAGFAVCIGCIDCCKEA
jgi:Plant transposon protein